LVKKKTQAEVPFFDQPQTTHSAEIYSNVARVHLYIFFTQHIFNFNPSIFHHNLS